MHPDYFEGILQLRHPTRELLEFIEIVASKTNQVAKMRKVTNGFDYHIVSQRFLRSWGKEIQRRFPGELVSSRTLFTRNRLTQKEVYRVTVLFRCYPFNKGDTVKMKGQDHLVLSIGKKVWLQNVKTKEKQWVEFEKVSLS
jgi:NMD protein affecting ribosome stability and mRNA decay